jgi:hypothetical protein
MAASVAKQMAIAAAPPDWICAKLYENQADLRLNMTFGTIHDCGRFVYVPPGIR